MTSSSRALIAALMALVSSTAGRATTPTPGPVFEGSVLHAAPPGGRFFCAADFELRLANAGTEGSVLTISDVAFSHGYSQGYYAQDFHWDLSGIAFPVILRKDESISIPISYRGPSQSFGLKSRLHVNVVSDAARVDPSGIGPYYGEPCNTPTPTPGELPDLEGSNVRLHLSTPTTCGAAPAAQDEVCVRNNGIVPSGPFTVIVHQKAAPDFDEFRMDGFAALEERCVLRPYRGGDVELIVDYYYEIDEFAENNRRRFFVPPPPTPGGFCSPTPTRRSTETPDSGDSNGGCAIDRRRSTPLPLFVLVFVALPVARRLSNTRRL